MRPAGLLHPELLALLAEAGHGDAIVLADAGLRVPRGARVLHLGLTTGVPSIAQTVAAIVPEVVVETAVVASEFADWNPVVHAEVLQVLPVTPTDRPHADLMAEMATTALAYVKTGECSAFASVVLVTGVRYFEDAVRQWEELHGRPFEG